MQLIRFTHVTLLVVAWMTARTCAQLPAALDFEEAFSIDFPRSDLPVFGTDLRLDQQQASILQTLQGDYEQEFTETLGNVRGDLRDVQSLLGAEAPQVDQRREEIREQISTIFEQLQQARENPPPGSDVNEITAKYQHELQALQEELQRLRPARMTPEQVAKMFDDASLRLEQWRAKKRELGDKFAGDARAILHEEQRELWPGLERHLRRNKLLGQGRLQGESVNLLTWVRDLNLDPAQTEAVAPTLQDYEMRLDEALRARQQVLEASDRPLFKAIQSGDRSGLENLIERLMAARVVVRNVNDEFAQRLAGMLPAELGPRATSEYRSRGYPLVYRSTQTLRLMKAAAELEGLTPQQGEALSSMRSEYETGIAAMNEQVLAVVREHEPHRVQQREVGRLLPPAVEQEQVEPARPLDPIQEAFTRREEFGRPFNDRLQALLGEELFERLPRGRGADPATSGPPPR